jgi:uncharacterized protein YdaU (DUF1376 family)
MDRPDVFMPLYIGDYLAGTSRLTTELHGAYMLLIMDYWMNGALPDDNNALASIARMNLDAWSIARAVLEKYFSIDDGVWIHKRIEEELQKAVEKKSKAKEKAEKAAKARWGNAPSIPQAMLKECPSPSPSPSLLKTKDIVIPTESEHVPIQEIVSLFNKSFPDLPQVQKVSDARRKAVRQRWIQNPELQTIEKWERFFNYVKQSDFLMGRTSKPWSGMCFDWLFNPTNFIKIYEGNYHGEQK